MYRKRQMVWFLSPFLHIAKVISKYANFVAFVIAALFLSSFVQRYIQYKLDANFWKPKRLVALPARNDPTFFPEIFPLEEWTGVKPFLVIPRAFSQEEVPDRAREQEALAALSAAKLSRSSGNAKKTKTIIEHALALAPHHPDILTERRKRTLPLVNAIDTKLLQRIEKERDEFSRLPVTSTMKRAMRESYFLHIYHSVAIEGNTLTLGQTRSILESGVAVAGKSILEHNEVIGMDAALRFLNHSLLMINEIAVDDILEMHRRVLGNANPIDAGRIRTTQVFVGRFTPIAPEYVKEQLEELISWLNDPSTLEMSPIEKAAIAHYKLVVIHPFVDGNGRTARLLLNLILMRAGFPPVILPVESRAEYYATLHTANLGDLRPFIRYIARYTENTLKFYIGSSESCVGGACADHELGGEESERIQS
ncbi:Fic family protein [Dictyocaulus viviparus]|uniref:Fic family protein n=1 Tax=Dictyocaulus viviparus TaxID=29172 RepID=A0A0D8XZI1_DICVI|nr:Fic family protein [Dictyocaulus viviparus]